MSPESTGVLFLCRRVADHRHVGTHGDCKLHAHVSQTAQTHHTHPHARADLPLGQWIEQSDACAQQRSGAVE